jgi:hypothetical protein
MSFQELIIQIGPKREFLPHLVQMLIADVSHEKNSGREIDLSLALAFTIDGVLSSSRELLKTQEILEEMMVATNPELFGRIKGLPKDERAGFIRAVTVESVAKKQLKELTSSGDAVDDMTRSVILGLMLLIRMTSDEADGSFLEDIVAATERMPASVREEAIRIAAAIIARGMTADAATAVVVSSGALLRMAESYEGLTD